MLMRSVRLLLGAALLLAVLPVLNAADEVPKDKARLIVRLPAEAKLLIGTKATTQKGEERRFLTPKLAEGKERTFTLTATWTEAGKEQKLTREVKVKRGQSVAVDFNPEQLTVKPFEKPKKPGKKPKKPSDGSKPARPSKEPEPPKETNARKGRTFQLDYGVTVTGLKAGEKARVWMPVPTTSADQKVNLFPAGLPVGSFIEEEPKFGNRILSFETKADADGNAAHKVSYKVTRYEVKSNEDRDLKEDADRLFVFLQADAMVPVDGKPLDLLKGKTVPDEPAQAARVLYDVVNSHMVYKKEGTGWGRGDAVWACEHGYGNCTDFHSLFIALARSRKIPAKFEIGFALPEKRGAGTITSYHCWAKFNLAGKGWVPVDISEASKNPALKDYYFGNLTADRVTFSVGRDIDLRPKQAGPALNFFIFPHVEVDGKPYPREKVETRIEFKDG